MAYVYGYLIPLPKKNVARYRSIARRVGRLYKEFGATEFIECLLDDPKTGSGIAFPAAMKLKRNETALLSWIKFESRAARNRINKLVRNDERMLAVAQEPLAFDMARMVFGGFKPIVSM
jgi:uncharacterized protein YbaA (DUF1428 family)